ncbi:FtsX-like permease family protein [Nocardioides ferulae]|uniref:FtsX-like permease family protein n=1 Tax=Nocardioides ferulae TaxID=2340821 RepID=UPI0013DE58DD|nr:ABC transporter permease [Nocardioides ferulae]
MIGLALRSVRHRADAFAATFVTLLLGTTLMGSFATLAETATGPVSELDAETLTVMGLVVGAWGTVIVLFATASTVGIAVGQRTTEVATLRTIGATPRQARRLVRLETLTVALAAALGGAALAGIGGRLLLAMVRDGGLVADDVRFGGGPRSLGGVALVVVATSLVAAGVAARRTTRGPVREALASADVERSRLPRWRVALAVLLVGYGAAMAVVTVTVTADAEDPYAAMQTSGAAGIVVAVGLALVAAPLLRGCSVPLRWLGRGTWAQLAGQHLRHRARLLAGLLGPVIVLTSAATSILTILGIDDRTRRAAGVPAEEAQTINLLNLVVVGMIVVFAAILVVSSTVALLAHRRPELVLLWRLGATPDQVRAAVVAESLVVAVVGVLLGSLAALVTVVPFSVARDEGLVPDGQLWLPPLVVAAAVTLTVLAARTALRRTMLDGTIAVPAR